MLFQPMPVQNHIGYSEAIGGWALVYMKPFISDLIVVVLTPKGHFTAFDFDVPFTPATIADVENTGPIAIDLNRVLPRIPMSAKIIVLR